MTGSTTGSTAGSELPTGVSLTAVGIAVGRAVESDRADALFRDRHARAFVDACGAGAVAGMGAFSGYVAIRTRFFDDYLLGAARRGRRQVVLLAAGLDTRAFRLPWPPGTHLFELDLPALLAFKEDVLAREGATASCRRTALAADLREDWAPALRAAGFDPAVPTAWLAEGLLPYLSTADNDLLADRIGRLSATGSELALDHLDSETRRGSLAGTSDALDALGASWLSTLDDPAGWLAGHGWTVRDAPARTALLQRYGRGGAAPAREADRPSGLASAVREA
ncbi:SAM-dependent methyltransferase [Streptomyces sp. UNOC14_S4]|uniref:SAM-dependent methyltransferase n=1 Tax=Streptomyces sp. UNOC14_S4 TaxID=2872340 RepID=UPI001E34CE8F|nr:SAM-dependent methyltransferase [Streptomyces sp. UNOC14_S4]MCC3767127.1 SAM-dependent methyltransferase [Streptomyces sp. UNOC14_S4]